MDILGNIKRAENNKDNNYCDICDYKCNKIYNWNRHINTPKHIRKSKRAKTSQMNIMRFYIHVSYVIKLIKQIVVYGNIQNYVQILMIKMMK